MRNQRHDFTGSNLRRKQLKTKNKPLNRNDLPALWLKAHYEQARAMQANGYDAETISSALGITLEELSNLFKQRQAMR